jgi:pyruvate formate lyase activating enzyme
MLLREMLSGRTRKAELVEPMDDAWVRCTACGHRCKIAPGHEGICRVRFNRDGILYAPFGYVAGLAVDPIEKKPFFHVKPGSKALSFGMLGCDYHCAYCQNWFTSQALRDPEAGTEAEEISAEEIVRLAVEKQIPVLTSTYNEPLITSEWAVDIFRRAKSRGIRCSFVSNGNGTPEVVRYIRPFIDCYKVDLKSFQQKHYQQLGGKLDHVLDTIRLLKHEGVWVEIVTLVVPGFNDSDDELRDIAEFVAGVSTDIPWHVTAFHPDYNMTSPPRTPARTLQRAAEIGKSSGLDYVYAGNLPGAAGTLENTCCPACKSLLVERHGFTVKHNRLVNGHCPDCKTPIPGIW